MKKIFAVLLSLTLLMSLVLLGFMVKSAVPVTNKQLYDRNFNTR